MMLVCQDDDELQTAEQVMEEPDLVAACQDLEAGLVLSGFTWKCFLIIMFIGTDDVSV